MNEQVKAKLTLNNELKNLKDNNIKLDNIILNNLSKIVDLEYKFLKYENELKADISKRDAKIKEMAKNVDHFESSNIQWWFLNVFLRNIT